MKGHEKNRTGPGEKEDMYVCMLCSLYKKRKERREGERRPVEKKGEAKRRSRNGDAYCYVCTCPLKKKYMNGMEGEGREWNGKVREWNTGSCVRIQYSTERGGKCDMI